ncbi:hypothetical protein GCM10022237_25310 [Nocardioides ginsengisoli]|uniref:DUF2306 domain-containing protein n=1 Tax=Nocardioides ginsengisoli TaxID=363868 RepID=A0ABW3W5B9_9ACTN
MLRRIVLAMLALVLLAYVPLAATSMWFTILPGFPRLQEQLDARLGGHAYAWGSGSVAAVRTAAYVDHRVALLAHTMLGAVALCLLLVQAVVLVRARRGALDLAGALHRRVGRAYAGAVVLSMVASFVFLARAPHVDLPGQAAFRLQLWLLGASTIGTLAAGAAAARRGDRDAHRAWMVLNACFLATAPILRSMWSTLGALVPEHTMLTNLEVSAVSLAVVAPAAGATAHAWEVRRGSHRSAGRRQLAFLAAAGVVGEVLVLARFRAASGEATPASYPWFHVVPMVIFALLVACRARNGPIAAGLAAAPWAVLVTSAALAPSFGVSESLRAGLLCGPGAPLVASLAFALRSSTTSRRALDRGPTSRDTTGPPFRVPRAAH